MLEKFPKHRAAQGGDYRSRNGLSEREACVQSTELTPEAPLQELQVYRELLPKGQEWEPGHTYRCACFSASSLVFSYNYKEEKQAREKQVTMDMFNETTKYMLHCQHTK